MKPEAERTAQTLRAILEQTLTAAATFAIFADEAKAEGHAQLAARLQTAARSERSLAALWIRVLAEGDRPATLERLRTAAEISNELHGLYQNAVDVAVREENAPLARRLTLAAAVEKNRARQFRILAKNFADDNLYRKAQERAWVCGCCGHLHDGVRAPARCPLCAAPRGEFSLYCENY